METNESKPNLWTNTQTYSMALICLILGLAVGYLMHTPEDVKPTAPAATNSTAAASAGMGNSMPTAADLKRMADKQVEPLLAQLQKNPKDPQLLAQIGRAYFAAQQFQTAVPYYEQSAAAKADPEVLNELAFAEYSLGDPDKGIAALNRALAVDPKNAKALFNLGMFEWHGKSDPEAAIAAWQKFVKANPNDPKRQQVEQMIAQAKQHLNIAPGTKTDKPAM